MSDEILCYKCRKHLALYLTDCYCILCQYCETYSSTKICPICYSKFDKVRNLQHSKDWDEETHMDWRQMIQKAKIKTIQQVYRKTKKLRTGIKEIVRLHPKLEKFFKQNIKGYNISRNDEKRNREKQKEYNQDFKRQKQDPKRHRENIKEYRQESKEYRQNNKREIGNGNRHRPNSKNSKELREHAQRYKEDYRGRRDDSKERREHKKPIVEDMSSYRHTQNKIKQYQPQDKRVKQNRRSKSNESDLYGRRQNDNYRNREKQDNKSQGRRRSY